MDSSWWVVSAVAVVGVIGIGGVIYGYVWERVSWNGGRCRKCGAPLICFDVDSQGGRGYKCSEMGQGHPGPWISYPGIDGSDGS
jgi:hypothetical protein